MSSTPTSLPGPTIVKESPPDKSSKRKLGRPKSKPKERAEAKVKPSRVLPTDRITFERQLDILRAYAAATDNGNKPTSLEAVAGVLKMVVGTVTLANRFFINVGLLQKNDSGFLPAPEVVNFLRAYSWNTETASHKLAPLIQTTWFAEALIPKLRFGTLEEEQAITSLAEASGAEPEYRKQLRMLIDYMVAAGLIQRDGNMIKLAQSTTPTAEAPPPPQSSVEQPQMSVTETQNRNRVLTAFTQTPEGSVNFNIQIRVGMEEFSGWGADRIAAFFAGLAQVLAAKAKIEKDAAG